MLAIKWQHWLEMVAEAWHVYPLEACGVFLGEPGSNVVESFAAISNEAQSSRVYALDSSEFAKVSLKADRQGLDVVGVFHSHTHTVAYPSPTDVEQASGPLVPNNWHWAILSLGWGYPEIRSFLIADGGIVEEPVALTA